MKKIILYTTILAAVATACSKLDNEPLQKDLDPDSDVVMITEKVSANVNPSSKADIAADASFAWSDGDQLAVHVSDGKYYTTEALATGGSKSATFSITYPEGKTRDAFAVYPASIVAESASNYGQSGKTLDVTLPSSYTLAQVSGTTTPCPMIATNTAGEGWEFKQLCGFIRLTVNNIPETTKRIEIDFDSKKVCGSFSIATPVAPLSSVIATSTDASNDKISITKDGTDCVLGSTSLVLNIPLPIGDYPNIIVVAYNNLSGGDPTILDVATSSYTAKRAKGKKLTASLAPKVFSVSSDGGTTVKHVNFSPGNLRATYTASTETWTWSFASHQYDYIGNGGGNKIIFTSTKETTEPYAKLSDNGIVDLFGFSTNKTYYGIAKSTNNSDYSGDFIDWGSIDIDGNGTGYWRTLNHNEGQYLIWGRPNTTAQHRFAKLTTNSFTETYSVILIFPDGFKWIPSLMGTEPTDYYDQTNGMFTAWVEKADGSYWKSWTMIQAAGAVLLPMGDRRNGISWTTSGNTGGGYWYNDGYIIEINSKVMKYIFTNSDKGTSRQYGYAVRLVHEVD